MVTSRNWAHQIWGKIVIVSRWTELKEGVQDALTATVFRRSDVLLGVFMSLQVNDTQTQCPPDPILVIC